MTMGNTVVKGKSVKIRRIHNVLIGCAGSTADAFKLIENFEIHYGNSGGQMLKAAVNLAKQWRTDKIMTKLDAVLCLSDIDITLLLDGSGNVIEPDDGNILAIGSGGSYALSSARALIQNTELNPKEIAIKSMEIASDLCIYTNKNFTILQLDKSNLVEKPFESNMED